jgi:two-component system phosphate regulon sensor histidine kinase PhoR
MKKKLNQYLIGISVLAIVLTLLFTVLAFWKENERQAMEEVRSQVALIASFDTGEDPAVLEKYIASWKQGETPIRITRIAADGTVLFDNFADPAAMENHAGRPEVKAAMQNGTGESTRSSATLGGSTTCYYAQRLQDGSVLRGAVTTAGIGKMFGGVLPFVFLIAAAAVLLAILFSWYLTAHFIDPIRAMADHPLELRAPEAYPELQPLLDTIKDQQKDVISAARMRQEFTANVSHELKTPLASISGYAELIETGIASPKDTARFGKEIHENAERLLKLINDIIRLSELDMGSVGEEHQELVDLHEAAEKCAESLQLRAGDYGVAIDAQGRKSVLHADRQQMDELLWNLCDNAIRYNKKGGSVHVTVDHDDEKVILKVKDTGIGIPKEHQQRIFERFYRVDKSRSRETGGTGLGLAIVKHIVQEAGGEIQLESEPGEGTEITVLLPVKKQ